ncbi:hypothetical protein KAR91_86465 [Candidatus Pacearchaeota archaeon]|nr:hypothetical protein [Candidatus Pacearchaeota archaeon]
MITVKVSILGRRPGSIIKAGDKDFETFKRYAEKKATRAGALICTMKDPSLFDRPAAVARLEELGVEFKGNMSNDNMAQLLIDSEEAALNKGDIRLSRDFVVDKLNELEVAFDEGMGDDDLEKLMRDTEEQLAEAAACDGDQDGPDENDKEEPAEFNRAAAMARLSELDIEFKGNISNANLEQLLKDTEAGLLAPAEAGSGGTALQETEKEEK